MIRQSVGPLSLLHRKYAFEKFDQPSAAPAGSLDQGVRAPVPRAWRCSRGAAPGKWLSRTAWVRSRAGTASQVSAATASIHAPQGCTPAAAASPGEVLDLVRIRVETVEEERQAASSAAFRMRLVGTPADHEERPRHSLRGVLRQHRVRPRSDAPPPAASGASERPSMGDASSRGMSSALSGGRRFDAGSGRGRGATRIARTRRGPNANGACTHEGHPDRATRRRTS